MKYVLDSSVALKWYRSGADFPKALKLRMDFHVGIHELLAPDILFVECGDALMRAERKGIIGPGETDLHLVDLLDVGVPMHPSSPLLQRAAGIALSTRISFYAGVYLALAEREKCDLLDRRPEGNSQRPQAFSIRYGFHVDSVTFAKPHPLGLLPIHLIIFSKTT